MNDQAKTRIFFWGTPEIAIPSLRALSAMDAVEIVGVGVFPDKKVGRKQILTPCPVKLAAQALGLPVVEIASKQDLETCVEKNTFDLGIVIAFGMIFPESILDCTPLGIVNVHFSLLPKYRGASPVQSAILSGDTTSGITFQRMVKKMDAGDILWQEKYEIQGKKTSDIFLDFSEKSAHCFPEFIQNYTNGEIKPVSQEESQITLCGKFKKTDGAVDPESETAEEIMQKYRAFDLFPGIFMNSNKGAIKLLEVSLVGEENSYPLPCKDDSVLYVKMAQVPGKKPLPVNEILKGQPKIFDFENAEC